MVVASLLGGVRTARYNGQQDDSCGAQECGAPKAYFNSKYHVEFRL